MSPRDPDEMMAAVAESMEERTGRTVEEWVELVLAGEVDPHDERAVRRWLEEKHDVDRDSRWAIADAAVRAAAWEPPTFDEHLERQYGGPEAELRPIFDRLREMLESFGDDISVEGRETYMLFVRSRQFAAVAAATESRVDVGLRFTDPPESDRLDPAGGPGRATHRISLTSPDEIDEEVERLLRAAYEQNG